jgi:hypothetical protein
MNGPSSQKRGAAMSSRRFFCLILSLFFSAFVFAQTPPENAPGLDDAGKAIAAVLPLAGEEAEMTLRFYQGTIAAVAALEKYSPRPVDPSVFAGTDREIPTDMPPHRDLVPGVRYALTGGVYSGAREGEYYLQLWLWEMTGSTIIYTDDLVYEDIDQAMSSLPGLVEWLFSHIHELTIETPEPLVPPDPFFVLGLRLGPSQRWYTDPDEDSPGAWALNLEGGVSGAFRLNSLLAFQAEILFSADTLVYRGLDAGPGANVYTLANEKYTGFSLMFPLLLRVNLRPGPFKISPLAGVYATVPLGQSQYKRSTGEDSSYDWSLPVPLGFTGGVEAAFNWGPGAIFGGLRYAGDFSNINIDNDEDTTFRRNMFSFSLGYEFGFFDKNKK